MNYEFISKTVLFKGCCADDIRLMHKQLNFRTLGYDKGSTILSEGDIVTDIGIVLFGSVQIEHYDVWGNKSILGIVESGGVFAEAYACLPNEPLMVNVTANENCEILFISVPALFQPCSDCASRCLLLQNLIKISARKNLQLSARSLHTSPKTIRARLLSYFSQQISLQGSREIKLPFNRQQLADYLNLDRSALSKELARMKRDGLIEYNKNRFYIKIDVEPEYKYH